MNLVENRLDSIESFIYSDVSNTLINHNNRLETVEVVSTTNELGIADLSQAIFTWLMVLLKY